MGVLSTLQPLVTDNGKVVTGGWAIVNNTTHVKERMEKSSLVVGILSLIPTLVTQEVKFSLVVGDILNDTTTGNNGG